MTTIQCPECRRMIHWYKSNQGYTRLCLHNDKHEITCPGSGMPTSAIKHKEQLAVTGRCYSVEGRCFTSLQDAVIHAREKARDYKGHDVRAVTVVDQRRIVAVAVVTDDANSLTVHRLATWPTDEECAY